jgi:hypothetical protein
MDTVTGNVGGLRERVDHTIMLVMNHVQHAWEVIFFRPPAVSAFALRVLLDARLQASQHA